MCTSRRGFARVLVWSAFLAAGLVICGPVGAQSKGGGKPPPTSIYRPICFWGPLGKNSQTGILRSDENGASVINVNARTENFQWPRWSPDGRLIGCYRKDHALMVMNPDGTNERVIMTDYQFNAWNLARPGVLASAYPVHDDPCWLGNNAIVFSAGTTYDASYFGGTPGTTVTNQRLFVVDATGTITPLTDSVTFGLASQQSSPHWSAALNKVVFVGSRNEIYAVNPDGTGLTQITLAPNTWIPEQVAWSPTGDRLVVSATGLEGDRLDILEVDLDQPNPGMGEGGRVTNLTPFITSAGNFWLSSPAWSADGTQILCVHLGTLAGWQGYFLVIRDVATGASKVISGPHGSLGGADWDPLDLP